jgi:hypothetical protein
MAVAAVVVVLTTLMVTKMIRDVERPGRPAIYCAISKGVRKW